MDCNLWGEIHPLLPRCFCHCLCHSNGKQRCRVCHLGTYFHYLPSSLVLFLLVSVWCLLAGKQRYMRSQRLRTMFSHIGEHSSYSLTDKEVEVIREELSWGVFALCAQLFTACLLPFLVCGFPGGLSEIRSTEVLPMKGNWTPLDQLSCSRQSHGDGTPNPQWKHCFIFQHLLY